MQTALNSFTQPLDGVPSAPEWVHLVPAGSFAGVDGRGPYELSDAAKVIASSMLPGRKLPIDINHSIDHNASKGGDTPASGWIVAMEARADGVWGKVEWTANGRSQVESKAYGYLSPVFLHTKAKPHKVLQLLRAALTNDPNLVLTALHNRTGESDMEKELREALGLPETADQAAILAAVTAAHTASTAMATIAIAAGAKNGATAAEIVTAINTRKSGDDDAATLREEIKQLNTRLTTAVTDAATTKAVTVVDKAIDDGKLVPALRDRFIARHMKDPADVEAEIKLMPSLNAGGLGKRRVIETAEGELQGDDAAVCELMGIDPKAFATTAKAIAKERN